MQLRGRKRRSVASHPTRLSAVRAAVEALETRWMLTAAVWTGNAHDGQWSNAANWTALAVPSAGQDVQLPALGGNGVTQISLSGNVEVGSLTFSGAYHLNGGSVTLDGDVTSTSGTPGAQIDNVVLTHNTTVTVDTSDYLTFLTTSDGGNGYGIYKTGEGKLELAGNSGDSYTGLTEAAEGTLEVDANIDSTVNVDPGATLQGNGSVAGILDSGGTVAMFLNNSAVSLTSAGGITFSADATLSVGEWIQGPMSENGYLVADGGPIDLNGASFSVNYLNNTAPALNQTYTLIANNTGQPVFGTFDNLSQDGTITTSDGVTYQISYFGGASGFDVTATVTDISAVWTGAGNDGLWSNPANWYGNQIPASGEDVILNNAGPQLENIDVDGSYVVGNITLQNVILSGNDLQSSGSFFGTGDNYILNNIVPQQFQSLAEDFGGTMYFGGTIQPQASSNNFGLYIVGSSTVVMAPMGLDGNGNPVYEPGANIATWGSHMFVLSGSTLRFHDDLQATVLGVYPVTAVEASGASTTVDSESNSGSSTVTIENLERSLPDTLTTQNVVLHADTTLNFLIGGPIAGDGSSADASSQIVDTGSGNQIALNDAPLALTLSGGYVPQPGDVITLIDNQTGTAIAGTFAGLPEGAVILVGGYDFAISYQGGPNQQNVTLTPLFGSALSIQQQPPATAQAENTLGTITVNLLDSAGNLASDDSSTVTLTATPSGGGAAATLNGITTVAAQNGVATFTGLSLPTAGTYVITATDGTMTAATTTTVTVLPAAWTGQGFDDLWSDPQNWTDDQVPAPGADVTIDNPNGPGGSPAVIQVDGPVTVSSFALQNVVLTGDSITLTGSGDFTTTGNTSYIADPITLDVSATVDGTEDGLLLGGDISDQGAGLGITITGASHVLMLPITVDGNGNIAPALPTLQESYLGDTIVENSSALGFNADLAGRLVEDNTSIAEGMGRLEGFVGSNAATMSGLSITGTPGLYPGTLVLEGPSSLQPGGYLQFFIGGSIPGDGRSPDGYSQIVLDNGAGQLNLNDATLETTLTNVYIPQPGDVITLIRNESGSPLIGTFEGIPDGSVVSIGGYDFVIDYEGGISGQDVTLTPLFGDQLSIEQQPSATAQVGNSIGTVTVNLLDSAGNVATDDSSDVTLTAFPDGGGPAVALTGTTTVAAQNGVATFTDLSLPAAGTYTLTATDGTLTAATMSDITIVPVTWTGHGFDTNWFNPLNWSADQVPAPGADITIVNPDIYASIEIDQPITVSSLSLTDVALVGDTITLTGSGQINGADVAVIVNPIALDVPAVVQDDTGFIALGGAISENSPSLGITVDNGSEVAMVPFTQSTISGLTLGSGQVSETYTGLTTVEDDSTLVYQANYDGRLVLSDTSTLQGEGQFEGITNSESLQQSARIEIENIDSELPGTLVLTDDTSLSPGTTLSVQVGGPSAGASSQIVLAPTVNELTLDGVQLQANRAAYYVPQPGDVVTLISNPNDVSMGTFAGLPQGAIVPVGPYDFTIDYQGGLSGHDVTLNPLFGDHLAIEPLPTTTAQAGTALGTISVQLLDSVGNVAADDSSSVTLTAYPTAGGPAAILTGTSTVAAQAGIATFTGLSLATPGTYVLTATDGSLATATSSTITVTAIPTPPAPPAPTPPPTPAPPAVPTETVVAGQPVSPTIVPPVSSSRGASAHASRVTVHFENTSDDGKGSFTRSYRVQHGQVKMQSLRFLKTGLYKEIVATATGQSVQEQLQVIPAAPSQLIFVQQPASRTAATVAVAVVDRFGNLTAADDGQIATLHFPDNPHPDHHRTLTGEVAAIITAGTATFSTVTLTAAGATYMVATAGALRPAASRALYPLAA